MFFRHSRLDLDPFDEGYLEDTDVEINPLFVEQEDLPEVEIEIIEPEQTIACPIPPIPRRSWAKWRKL